MHIDPTVHPSLCNDRYVIKVSGEGTISVTPDRALLTLGAITESSNLSAAQTDNATTVTAIISSLLQLGIPKEDIKTIDYGIEMQYDFENGKQSFRGYKVTHLLQVTLNQIDQTGLVVDTAVHNGANSVSNIQFTVAQPDAYYNHALSLAIKNGEQKALTAAHTLGVTPHRTPKQIQEVSDTLRPAPFQTALYAKSAATPIQPGLLKISAAVQSEYYYF